MFTEKRFMCALPDALAHITRWTHIKKLNSLIFHSSLKKNYLSLSHSQVSILCLPSLIFSSGLFNFSVHKINLEFQIKKLSFSFSQSGFFFLSPFIDFFFWSIHISNNFKFLIGVVCAHNSWGLHPSLGWGRASQFVLYHYEVGNQVALCESILHIDLGVCF